MTNFINFNGILENADKPLITVQNRGLRFGDGLFETMKCRDGNLPLLQLHLDRLFEGMKSLLFHIPTWLTREFLTSQIMELLATNRHQASSKVRLMVFRGDGALYEVANTEINFVIESFSIENAKATDEKLVIEVFPHSRKAADAYSSIKSNNFLPYVMGALYAKRQGLDDAIILNTNERICDVTIANIFVVKDQRVLTPALSEGCIAGVMRRYLIDQLGASHYDVEETTITQEQLYAADEVFLTNAASGLRPVTTCGNRQLSNRLGNAIKKQFLEHF